jgi:hypothetical protein
MAFGSEIFWPDADSIIGFLICELENVGGIVIYRLGFV